MPTALDRVAIALNMSMKEAHSTITELKAAFELNGHYYTFDQTAKLIYNAAKHRDLNNPDVRFATEWLKSV